MVKRSWTFPHQFIISVIVLVLLTLGCSIDEALWVYLLIILGNTMNYLISNFFSSGSYIPSIYSFCPMFRCWAYIVHIPQPYLQSYHVMVVVIVIHRCYTWVAQLVASLIGILLDDFQYHKSQSSERIHSVQFQPLIPSTTGTYLPPFGATIDNSNTL